VQIVLVKENERRVVGYFVGIIGLTRAHTDLHGHTRTGTDAHGQAMAYGVVFLLMSV
jgi:hypothetical protein